MQKSIDSVLLPGFWGRQTRKSWAMQKEDIRGHLSEMGVCYALHTLPYPVGHQ